MTDNEDFMNKDFSEEDFSEWATFNDIDTGRQISIKRLSVEACEDCVLCPDDSYKGPYKKGTRFTRIYTTGSNFYEVAMPIEEVREKL